MKTYLKSEATQEELNSKGVYCIRNIVNNKKYCGSTISSFRIRLGKHVGLLKLQKHTNKKLQNAWNKHGEACFEFQILKIVEDHSNISEIEQEYIDSGEYVYNLCLKVNRPPSSTKESRDNLSAIFSKKWILVSPDKNIFHVNGLRRFCQENSLQQGHLWKVANKEMHHSKGWIAYYEHDFDNQKMECDYKKVHGPKYQCINPDGKEFLVKNLKCFCKNSGLNYKRIFDGKRREETEKKFSNFGWKFIKL